MLPVAAPPHHDARPHRPAAPVREPHFHNHSVWESNPISVSTSASAFIQTGSHAVSPVSPPRKASVAAPVAMSMSILPADALVSDLDDDAQAALGRRRSLTTPFQAQVLRAFISITRFPATALRDEIGHAIGLTGRQVQVWFQNQRQKARKLIPAIDLDNEAFPLHALLASQPLGAGASSAYAAFTQKALPQALDLNREITTALQRAGVAATTQHLPAAARTVIAQYCGSNGGAGARAERSFITSSVPVSAMSSNSADKDRDRSRMPPPTAISSRHTASASTRSANAHPHLNAAVFSRASTSMSSSSASPASAQSPSPARQTAAEAEHAPDLLLPPLDAENVREALSRPAASRARELEIERESSERPTVVPVSDRPDLSSLPPVHPPTRTSELGSAGVRYEDPIVLLHPPRTKDMYIPAPVQTIPRQRHQRERYGVPRWWAHGPVDDDALDPLVVANLRRMGVMGNRRRPFLPPSHASPSAPMFASAPTTGTKRRWFWGHELRPRVGELESEPTSWEWEWEVPGLELPPCVLRRRPKRARLALSDAASDGQSEGLGLFAWLATGRFAGRAFEPANRAPPPEPGAVCVRRADGQWVGDHVYGDGRDDAVEVL